jgi:hypothetical protein
MEEILLKWIRASRNRQFNLIIAGRLSGIHGWKRMHIPIAFQVIDSTLILHFDGEERLVVADADGLAMQANGGLQVREASEVSFTWCSDIDPDRDCEETFRRVNGMFSFNRTDDLYTTATNLRPSEGEFVVLR